MDIEDFQKEVIDQSHSVPVLADFWAAWCGPCKMLGPVLESLAEKANGAWVLAKVDVEQHQEPASQYGVQGIPAVKLFSMGEVIAEFSGALPQPQIEAWLEEHLPSELKGLLEQAEVALANQDYQVAVTLGRQVESQGPSGSMQSRLAWLMGRALLFIDSGEAQRWLKDLSAVEVSEKELDSVRLLANYLNQCPDVPPEPPDLANLMGTGQKALSDANLESALEAFTSILWEKPDFADGQIKRLTLAIFHFLGMRHPLSEKYFRAYSAATNI